eukprot:COSAG02_NODE_2315_length_9154_cov_229.391055_3_plen_100_part_00
MLHILSAARCSSFESCLVAIRMQVCADVCAALDVFRCPDDQWACALLTHTGSDVHNRSMRHWCAQMGLALSEKALAPAQREERGCYRDNQCLLRNAVHS